MYTDWEKDYDEMVEIDASYDIKEFIRKTLAKEKKALVEEIISLVDKVQVGGILSSRGLIPMLKEIEEGK